MAATVEKPTRIENGIEWFVVRFDDGRPSEEDCQCARCGSSASFASCANCGGEGETLHDSWDGCGDGYYVRCDWCRGTGGSWHCISGPEWCEAHPLPGREEIASTAMNSEAWRDVD